MLDWTINAILAIVNSVPAVFVAQDSPNFVLIRAMFGLLLVLLIVFLIAMLRPVFATIGRYLRSAVSRNSGNG